MADLGNIAAKGGLVLGTLNLALDFLSSGAQKGNQVYSRPNQSASAIVTFWFFDDAQKGNLSKERPDQSAALTSEWFFNFAHRGNLAKASFQSAGNESAWDLFGARFGQITRGATPELFGNIAKSGNLVYGAPDQVPTPGSDFIIPFAQKGLLTYASIIGPPFVPPPDPPIDPEVPPGSTFGVLLRDELSGDLDANLLDADDPVIATGDQLYGNLDVVKETDAIMPNAVWTHGEQLKVQVHARNYISDEVDWTEQDVDVGDWHPELEEDKLTFDEKKRYGKVLRYRFVGTDLRGFRFDAFSVNVYQKGAQR